MPMRPDVSEVDQAARGARNEPRLSHQTAIDMLQKGDVLVVDAAGAQFGGIIGDNLAYYIMKTTKNGGLVVDGEWMPDPRARETVPNPFGGRNSLLKVASSLEPSPLADAEYLPSKSTNQ